MSSYDQVKASIEQLRRATDDMQDAFTYAALGSLRCGKTERMLDDVVRRRDVPVVQIQMTGGRKLVIKEAEVLGVR